MKRLWTLFAAAVLVAPVARAQEVTLPLDRYEDLRARSQPVPTEAPAPPAPFALEAAQVEITTGRGSARVSQRLTLSIYSDDWIRVPLGPKGSLTSTQLGTLDGRIETAEAIVLVARGRGRHSVRIESVVPLAEDETATRATRNGSLPLPAAALVTGSLLSGPEVEEVEIVGGGMQTATAVPHRCDFVGTPGATLFFQLRGAGRAAVVRPQQPARLEASAFTLARLARTRSRVEARVVFGLTSGEADAFALQLPAGYDVVSVAPPDLGWVQEGARLKLTPSAPVKALTLEIALTGEPQAAFAAPLVVPEGAARVRLLSAVHVAADGIPEMTDPGSSRRAEPGESTLVPQEAARLGVPVFVVRDPKRPPRWSVEWSETAALLSAQVDRLLVNALVGSSGQAAYQLWAHVRSSGSTAVVIAPPAGLELVSVERDGVAVLPGTSDAGLVIPLGSGSGVQVIHLSGLLSGLTVPEEGEMALPLPSSTAPFGQVEVAVRLPGDRSYALANPERAGEILGLSAPSAPQPPRARKGASAFDLSALVRPDAAGATRASSYFAAPGNSSLLQARWSALTGNLGPLAIRVKPSREKEEWF